MVYLVHNSPCSFDIDYPTECDDEWWDHPDPALAWRQPAGKPSTITYFKIFINLMQLLSFCLRTIVRLTPLALSKFVDRLTALNSIPLTKTKFCWDLWALSGIDTLFLNLIPR